jgi:Na+/proline symporter
LFLSIGVMLYTFYQHVPLPAPLGRTDEVLPLFVATQLPSGLAGFIVAAIVAAALSPSLSAMAATTVNDFYKPRLTGPVDEAALMRLSRRATIGWGIVQLGVALGAQGMDRSVLDAGLAVLSFASGAVLGAFIIATLMPAVSEPDALAGMAAGLATMTAVWAFTPLAWTWYVFVGAATTCGTAGLLTLGRRSPA